MAEMVELCTWIFSEHFEETIRVFLNANAALHEIANRPMRSCSLYCNRVSNIKAEIYLTSSFNKFILVIYQI